MNGWHGFGSAVPSDFWETREYETYISDNSVVDVADGFDVRVRVDTRARRSRSGY